MSLRALGFARTVALNRLGRERRPRLLTYTVTFKCNARCVMCDSWRIRSRGDLEVAEVERIFRQLPRLDGVRLTGGEPFVRPDLDEIAELARVHLRPLVLHVTTNGFLTERIVEFCERRERSLPLHLLVSIDGVGAKHDEVRGRAGAYATALETVRRLAPRRAELRLALAVNQTVVDRDGLEHYRLLRAELAPLGVRNQVVLAYDASATYSVERDVDLAPREAGEFTLFGALSTAEIEELLAEVASDLPSLPRQERLAKRYYLAGIRSRLLGKVARPNPRCVALHSHLRLFPNGDVPTCQFNSRVVGNLREQSFAEVWRGVLAAEQRRWVRRCPGCWAECEILPSAIYTGDLVGHALHRPLELLRPPLRSTPA